MNPKIIRKRVLDLKLQNDFKLIEDLDRLTDRYEVSRLRDRITQELFYKSFLLIKGSDQEFEDNWRKMRSILKIAFEFKIAKLIDNVMIFIAKKFDHFVDEDNDVLMELNDSTDGRLFPLMADKCFEFWDDLTELKQSLKLIKSFRCDGCKQVNKVEGIVSSTKCKGCGRPLRERLRSNHMFCQFINSSISLIIVLIFNSYSNY